MLPFCGLSFGYPQSDKFGKVYKSPEWLIPPCVKPSSENPEPWGWEILLFWALDTSGFNPKLALSHRRAALSFKRNQPDYFYFGTLVWGMNVRETNLFLLFFTSSWNDHSVLRIPSHKKGWKFNQRDLVINSCHQLLSLITWVYGSARPSLN